MDSMNSFVNAIKALDKLSVVSSVKEMDYQRQLFQATLAYHDQATLLVVTKKLIMVAQYEMKQAKQKIDSVQLSIDQQNKSIADCLVRSPRDGRVAAIYVSQDQSVGAMTPLVKLYVKKKNKVIALYSDFHIGKIHVGQKAKVRFRNFPDKPYTSNSGECIFRANQ